MNFKLHTGTGYMYCYCPSHPCANKAGLVMEHVYVMYNHIGRALEKSECVHHIDRNRANNELKNLQLMTLSEHTSLHIREDKNGGYAESLCTCGKKFTAFISDARKYCSQSCASEGLKRFNPSADELKGLVWKMPIRDVAKLFGVSDVSVAKRCRALKVERPRQGFWLRAENTRP